MSLMEASDLSRIGDRSTSDVVVRIRTQDGRDEWVYCHSHILVEKTKYFADRLSDNWPTCQILDSRNCVEVFCEESDFDHHVNFLRLLYIFINGPLDDMWYGVKNALGILRVAAELGCPQMVTACVNYLEAVPWEEGEEEEILRIIPSMGLQVEPILARLQPVNSLAIRRIFLSAVQFATSSPASSMNDLKTSAQEQLEYMLTEDDDAPLLIADEEMKLEVMEYIKHLFARFSKLMELMLGVSHEPVSELENMQLFRVYLSDLSWACQILNKLEIIKEFVISWVDATDKILQVVGQASTANEMVQTNYKVVEVAAKVLEAIACGTVIFPCPKRLHLIRVWLPFVRATKSLLNSVTTDGEDTTGLKTDGELWQSLESTFVALILTLPSGDQADILTEWLRSEHVSYPDLTEAFEVWCYRSKVAKRRLKHVMGNDGIDEHL